MDEYSELKTKWRKSAEEREADSSADNEGDDNGVFCAHITDAGGDSMACYSSVELTRFFDNEKDALAYFRFSEIPHILDFDSGVCKEGSPDEAEAYLGKYEADKRNRIELLLDIIDTGIAKSEKVSKAYLSMIRETFNETFSTTNPEVQILAWGSLYETLTSPYFNEIFEEDLLDEEGQDEKPSTELKELLVSNRLNEEDKAHLDLAKDFLERHMSA